MRRARREGVDRRIAAHTAMAIALVFLAFSVAGTARAAEEPAVTWGEPTATAVLGEETRFATTFSSADTPVRVELLSRLPTQTTSFVEIAESSETGPGAYEATVTRTGHITPNTTFRYQFRVTTETGSVLGPEAEVTVTDESMDWQVTEGELVRLHTYEGEAGFRARALEVGEEAIAEVSALLGVSETDPVDFFVYADEQAFYRALGPGTRENVGGQAHADIRTLFALIRPEEIGSDWIDVVIPHELAHLVFDTAVENDLNYPPRWLNEGLAVYVSEGYTEFYRDTVRRAVASQELIPLDGLAGFFPTSRDRFFQAYAESVSAVDFFIRQYGEERLVSLIRSYADGVTDDEAFRAAAGVDAAEFNAAWLADLGATEPTAYGPQEAPAGPVPPGWDAGASPASGSASSPGGSAAPSTSVGPSAATGPLETASGSAEGASAGGGRAGGDVSSRGNDVVVIGGTLLGLAGLVVLAVVLVRNRERPDRGADSPDTSRPG